MRLTLAILFTWLVIYCRGRALSLPPSLISGGAAAIAQRQRTLQHQRQHQAAMLSRAQYAATIPVRRLRLHGELAAAYAAYSPPSSSSSSSASTATLYENIRNNNNNNNNNYNVDQDRTPAQLLIESPYERLIERAAAATAGEPAVVVGAQSNLHDINRHKASTTTTTTATGSNAASQAAGLLQQQQQQQQQRLAATPQRLNDAAETAGAYDLNIVLPHNHNNNNNNNVMGMQSRDMLPTSQERSYELNNNNNSNNKNSILNEQHGQGQPPRQLTTEFLTPLKYWARHCVPAAATTTTTTSTSPRSSSSAFASLPLGQAVKCRPEPNERSTATQAAASHGRSYGYADKDDDGDNRRHDAYYGNDAADELDFVDTDDADYDADAEAASEGADDERGIDALYANLEHLRSYELGKVKPATNDATMLLSGERDMVKFLYWALEHLYPFHKSLNFTFGDHPGFQQWKKLNLSGRLEPRLLVDEPHYIIVRREPLPEDFQNDAFYGNDPFIPPRGRKHNLPDLDALLHRYETFVPNRGRRANIKDILQQDDVFFPNRGKKPSPPLSAPSPLRRNWPLPFGVSGRHLSRAQKRRLQLYCWQQYATGGHKFSNRIYELYCANDNSNINRWPQQQQPRRMSTFKINGHDQSVKLSMPATNVATVAAVPTVATATMAATNSDAPLTLLQQQQQWLANYNYNNNEHDYYYDDNNELDNNNNNNLYAGRVRRIAAGDFGGDGEDDDGDGDDGDDDDNGVVGHGGGGGAVKANVAANRLHSTRSMSTMAQRQGQQHEQQQQQRQQQRRLQKYYQSQLQVPLLLQRIATQYATAAAAMPRLYV